MRIGPFIYNETRHRKEKALVYGTIVAESEKHRHWDVKREDTGAILKEVNRRSFHQVWKAPPLPENRGEAAEESKQGHAEEDQAEEDTDDMPVVLEVDHTTTPMQLAAGSGYIDDVGTELEVSAVPCLHPRPPPPVPFLHPLGVACGAAIRWRANR